MRTLKFIVIVLIICQMLSGGRILPALAGSFIAMNPAITEAPQKQTVMDKEMINDRVIKAIRSRIAVFILPKVKKLINIDKIADDFYRLRKKTLSNA